MKKILFSILLMFVTTSFAFAQQAAITNGLSYLQSTQSVEGYWGDAAEVGYNTIIDTASVADTLKYLGDTGASYSLALQWLNTTATSNTNYLATKINTLAHGGWDTTTLLNDLFLLKNSDGGWGVGEGFESDTKRTALTLLSLHTTSYPDQTVIDTAINYLISTQNPDGGWGFYQGDTSNIYMTSLVSWTLQKFPQTTSIATALNNATDYLIFRQQTDGSWGSVYETAHAYIALVAVSTDATVLGSAIDYLTTTQLANGSWNDDPYSTALALRALHYSQNKPVLPPPPPTQVVPIYTGPQVTDIVTDTSTGLSISGADVVVIGENLSTTTATDGTYTITGITLLDFSIRASATGYDSKLLNVTTTDYGTYTIDFPLNPSQVSNLKITALTTDKLSYPAHSDVIITGTIENAGVDITQAEVNIEDIQGNTIAVIDSSIPFIDFDPLLSSDVSLIWNTTAHGMILLFNHGEDFESSKVSA